MVQVMISLEGGDTPLADLLIAEPDIEAKPVKRDRITGGSELATVLIALTPVIATAVVKILKEKWARNAKVSIEARGIKVKGASPEDVERILRQILENTEED